MATEAKNPIEKAKEIASSKQVQEIDQRTKPFQRFLTKFNNDGVMTFAGTLAYSLMLAMFPFLIALLAILGIILGKLSPETYQSVQNSITQVFPGQVANGIIKSVLTQLTKSPGLLLIVAILTAVFGGSRLFIVFEQFLDLVYHVRPRPFIPQNVMALGMLLAFIIIVPIMVVASSAPALILGLSKYIPFLASNKLVSGLITFVAGTLGGILASFILFEVMYVVIPNQKISWNNSWRGSLVAAVLLELYLIAFPFYASNFLKGYAGVVGGGIILLLFFYYFAVILLLGGEINAFFSEHVQPLPNDIFTFTSTMAGRINKDRPAKEARDHIDATPTEKADDARFVQSRAEQTSSYQGSNKKIPQAKSDTKNEKNSAKNDARATSNKNGASGTFSQEPSEKQEVARARARLKEQAASQKEMTTASTHASNGVLGIVIAAAFTVVVEFFHLRGQGK